MELSEIVALYKMKERTNLIYMRPSKRIGHCYIDPSKPLQYSSPGSNYGHKMENPNDLLRYDPDRTMVGVYKQTNDVLIFVLPKDLWVHSKTKDKTIKILYGSR